MTLEELRLRVVKQKLEFIKTAIESCGWWSNFTRWQISCGADPYSAASMAAHQARYAVSLVDRLISGAN